eukprot:s5115_g7.t1
MEHGKDTTQVAKVSFDQDAWAPSDLLIEGVQLLTGLYVPLKRPHHGQQVFRKAGAVRPQAMVYLFYWKERTCSPSGWWFCDKIGSNDAYAFARGQDSVPPEDGWIVRSCELFGECRHDS